MCVFWGLRYDVKGMKNIEEFWDVLLFVDCRDLEKDLDFILGIEASYWKVVKESDRIR